jgi:hypothetical protein
MSASIDRVVAPHPRGGWEVKAPDAKHNCLHSTSRSEALQWAWNIVTGTGGKIIVQRSDGTPA